MANLFEAVASNPSLMTEMVDAMRSAATSAGVTFPGDPLEFVQMASENPAFKSSLQSQLSQFAAAHGLSFEPEGSVDVGKAKAQLNALRDSPTQIPIGTPIALLFISAALLFIPSVFSSTGATLFGGDVIGKIEGVEPFK
ncbi:MAG TPA: hypothetical protein VLR90_01555 [Blastocatellia bacterium]|nr:hypothetical protein [Blastocatellia bacterium]